jgi:DNA-3-methyladenine glycosylase II
MQQFSKDNLHLLCDELAAKDAHLQSILNQYGYPPLWIRPNTFETLVLTILEQQVSLASAYAAYKKLKEKISKVTPQHLLTLTDDDLRSCYFSRQKIGYVRGLADALISRKLNLKKMETEEDEDVRKKLKKLKGIGDWTVDIYLLHALQRTDILPLGDLALIKAVQMILQQPCTKEEIQLKAESWRPFRSVATMMLWHYYIRKKNIKVLH